MKSSANPMNPSPAAIFRSKRGILTGLEIGIQTLLVGALAVWLLQGRPWGYAPEWALRVHAPWPLLRLWRAIGLIVALGALVGWLASGLSRPETGSSPRDPTQARKPSSERAAKLRVAAALLVLTLLGMGLQGSLHGLAELAVPLLVASTWSTVGTEYFRTAYEIRDVAGFLRDYPQLMSQAQYHVATHPPGAILFYWLGIRTLEQIPSLQDFLLRLAENWSGGSAAEIGIFSQQFPSAAHLPRAAIPAILFCSFLLMLSGSSVVLPVYLLVRLDASPRMALLAATCFCTVPSFLLFFQSLDQLVLVLATWTVYLLLLAVRRDRLWLFPVAGLIWGLTLFVSLGAVVLGLLTGGFLAGLAWQRRQEEAWPKWMIRFALFVGAAIGGWGWIALAGHFPPLQIIRQGLAAHARVTTLEFPRTYSIWVWLNGIDFAVFLGLPLSVWWGRSLWAAVRRAGRSCRKEAPQGKEAPAREPLLMGLNLALALTLLALDLSGKVRAEVGRIWLFMMPLAVVGLTPWLGEFPAESPEDRRIWRLRLSVTLGLQIVQVSLMALTMTPLVLPY